jgi:membrane protein CcdC involved in cytochrome C biogenesis
VKIRTVFIKDTLKAKVCLIGIMGDCFRYFIAAPHNIQWVGPIFDLFTFSTIVPQRFVLNLSKVMQITK